MSSHFTTFHLSDFLIREADQVMWLRECILEGIDKSSSWCCFSFCFLNKSNMKWIQILIVFGFSIIFKSTKKMDLSIFMQKTHIFCISTDWVGVNQFLESDESAATPGKSKLRSELQAWHHGATLTHLEIDVFLPLPTRLHVGLERTRKYFRF